MTAGQWIEWQAWYSLAPVGDELIDLHFAMQDNLLAHTAGSKEGKITDWLLRIEHKQPREQTVEEQIAVVRMWNAALGGKDQTWH